MDFAENLKRICDEKGTTPTALCKELGLSTSKVSAWCGGSLPKKPLLSKERIMFWLVSFKSGDIRDIEYQQRVIDTLVNSVYLYDEGDKGRKLVLTFNISGSNTLTIQCSDIEGSTPPNSANPNTLFFVKHCFGFVYHIEDVG